MVTNSNQCLQYLPPINACWDVECMAFYPRPRWILFFERVLWVVLLGSKAQRQTRLCKRERVPGCPMRYTVEMQPGARTRIELKTEKGLSSGGARL